METLSVEKFGTTQKTVMQSGHRVRFMCFIHSLRAASSQTRVFLNRLTLVNWFHHIILFTHKTNSLINNKNILPKFALDSIWLPQSYSMPDYSESEQCIIVLQWGFIEDFEEHGSLSDFFLVYFLVPK